MKPSTWDIQALKGETLGGALQARLSQGPISFTAVRLIPNRPGDRDYTREAIARVAESQDNYPYTAAGIASLNRSLSEKRFKTYLDHGQRNPEAAITLHLWNSRLSKALRFPLETVEITIRNRIHYALTDRWGENWPRAAGFVAAAAEKTQKRVDAAYGEVGQNAITDRVVAELSFGFWPPLLRGRFVDELWKERIDNFFPHLPANLDHEGKANLLAKLLGAARDLRNRISHLEPIFKSNLSLEHSNLGKLVSYACKDTAGWMRRHSTLNTVLRDGPSAVVSEPLPFKRAIKDAKVVAADQSLAEVWSAIMDGPRDFVIVTTEAGPRIIGNAEIGMWIRSKSADGIVDVENTLVGEVVAAIPPSPIVRRQVSISELRSAVSRHRTRHVVVTETGEVGQAPLGVIDILDLIA